MFGLRSRWWLRALLGACLLGVLGIAARDYQVRQPSYPLRRAREARARGDRASALIFLRELLAYEPRHAEAHLLFGTVCLEAARVINPSARLADVRPALEHFTEAAALRPRDEGLQRAVMDADAQRNDLPGAASAAERLLELRPGDADSHYLLAAEAVRTRDAAGADRHLSALRRLETPPRFRTLALEAHWLEQGQRDMEQEQLLERAVAEVLTTSARPQALASLTAADQAAMLALLFQSERLAPCVVEALARAEAGMTVLERLATAMNGDARVVGEGAQHAAALLQAVEGQIAAPPSRDQATAHRSLLVRFVNLAAVAVEKETATPPVVERAALAAVATGDDSRARALLERAIRTFEGQASVGSGELAALRLLLARRLYVAGQGRAAASGLKELADLPGTAGWAELLIGTLQLDEGKDVEAIEHLEHARDRLHDRPTVRVAFARALLAQRRWSEAVVYLNALGRDAARLDGEEQAWVRLGLGDAADLHRLTAWCYAELGAWPQAQVHLNSLKGTRHAGWAVRVSAERRAREQGPENAVAALEGARQAAPARLDLVSSEAAILTAQGKDEAASALLERFAADRPADLAAQAALLHWRLSRGRTGAATAQADALVARRPDDPTARLLLAETRLATGDPEAALTVCRSLAGDAGLAKSAPEVFRSAPLIGALAAVRLDQRPEAARLLEQAARASDDPATGTLIKGGRALVAGDYPTACSKLAAALAYSSLREPARIALTQAVLAVAASQSPDAADTVLGKLLEEHPRETVLGVLRVELALRRDRFAQALEQLDRLKALPSSRDEAEYLEALVWARREQWHHARAAVQAILKRRPDDVRSRLLLAQILLVQHEDRDALAEADEALRLAPDRAETTLLRADALERLGRRDDALACVEALAARQPRLAAPLFRLALLHASAGEAERSAARLEAARAIAPDPAAYLRAQVQCLCRLGRSDAAEARVRAAAGVELALAASDAFLAERQWERALAWTDKALGRASAALRPRLQARAADLLVLQANARPEARRPLVQAACDRWRAILSESPSDLVAANNLAWYLATELDQVKEASAILERARRGVPVEALPEQLIATLATIDRRLDRLPEAESLLERRAALRPEEPLAHFHLGLVYQAEKRPAVARQSLLRALRLGLDGEHAKQARAALDGTVVR